MRRFVFMVVRAACSSMACLSHYVTTPLRLHVTSGLRPFAAPLGALGGSVGFGRCGGGWWLGLWSPFAVPLALAACALALWALGLGGSSSSPCPQWVVVASPSMCADSRIHFHIWRFPQCGLNAAPLCHGQLLLSPCLFFFSGLSCHVLPCLCVCVAGKCISTLEGGLYMQAFFASLGWLLWALVLTASWPKSY